MKFDRNQIEQVLYVKNDCSVLEFVGYLKTLARHFNLTPLTYDEVVQILRDISEEINPMIKLQMISPVTNAEKVLSIISYMPTLPFRHSPRLQ